MRRRRKQRWSEMPAPQRAGIIGAVALQLGLTAAALLDLRDRPQTQVAGDKRVWVAASFVNFVGPIAYFAFGRRR